MDAKRLFLFLSLISLMAVGTIAIAQEMSCVIVNCHGLDIECGMDRNKACTMIYQLGDFCRQFAKCERIEGTCRFVENKEFRDCKECVSKCHDPDDPMKAFQCESQCRALFE